MIHIKPHIVSQGSQDSGDLWDWLTEHKGLGEGALVLASGCTDA